jgi:site-specific recombinase XerD
MTPCPPAEAPYQNLEEIFAARIQALKTPHRYYQVAVRRFLSYLQTDFSRVRSLSDLRRDPHLVGWIRGLYQQDPPLSDYTRRIYLTALRRLLRDLASQGHAFQPRLILAEDFPLRTAHRTAAPKDVRRVPKNLFQTNERLRMSHRLFGEILDTRIQTLATTLRPGTVDQYRSVACRFLSYLQTYFPQLRSLSELRRDPHLLGWLRILCQQHPPLSNRTRWGHLMTLRRLLHDLAAEGHLPAGLILAEDFPPLPQYFPRALSPEQDQRLQQELHRTDDLLADALLLTRATGIRIGECIDLTVHCLRSMGPNVWALHVPLGKLYTERLVPVDEDVRQVVTRILTLRALHPASAWDKEGWLLPRSAGHDAMYAALRDALLGATERAGCSDRITCHQLRHTYATEMLRLGVSLPALAQLLGHKDIRMTMRYLQVTQPDLQREFHLARKNAQPHVIPQLPLPEVPLSATSDLAGIHRALAAARHLLEMYRRQFHDEKSRLRLRRLENRLMAVASQLDRFATSEK